MVNQKFTVITLKELVTLDKEGKLEPYSGKLNAVWSKKKDKEYMKYFKESEHFRQRFYFHLTQEGIYQILDGKHRISLLLEFGKSLVVSELESFNKRIIAINVIEDWPIDEAETADFQMKLPKYIKAAKMRNWGIIKENRDLLEKLVAHDYFKNCHYLGGRKDKADWDYIEILLSFLRFQPIDAEKATLPSSLYKFVTMKIPYKSKIADIAFPILTFMESVFKGKDYVCRSIDFCCMAVFYIYDNQFYPDKEKFSESEIQTIYDEYVKMWNELEPCVILSPLARENLLKILYYIGLILDMVRCGKHDIFD
jgi:hypothetical protein